MKDRATSENNKWNNILYGLGGVVLQSLKFTLLWGKFQKMCYFCNTTPPKPYKILNHVSFPDVVLSLTCIYVLLWQSYKKYVYPKSNPEVSTETLFWASLYNKVNRRPAQLTFLMIWTIKSANSGLPPWFEENGIFFQSREARIGSPVVGFKRGEKCRSRSSIFFPEGRGAKK